MIINSAEPFLITIKNIFPQTIHLTKYTNISTKVGFHNPLNKKQKLKKKKENNVLPSLMFNATQPIC